MRNELDELVLVFLSVNIGKGSTPGIIPLVKPASSYHSPSSQPSAKDIVV